MRFLWLNGKVLSPGQTQWAPTLTSHDPNPPITLESAVAPPRQAQFVNGQSAAHVGSLVGFAGAALLWSSVALFSVPQGVPQAFSPYQAGPQVDANIIAPEIWSVIRTQPGLTPTEITSGTHAAVIAQANQSAQFFKASGSVFVPAAGGPFGKPYFVTGQESGEQAAPIFSGQTPLPAPAFKAWTVPPQESPEQTAPFLFGQQPLPSPAGKPIWTAWELQQGSESATVWGGNADLFVAAAQFNVPPKPFSAAPQESPEQVQPLVFGQQPLPTPPSRPLVTVRDVDQPDESAQFWGSEATRFIAGTQFNLPPTASRIVGPQESGEQASPEFEHRFFAPVPIRSLAAGPQESLEQAQPWFSRQYWPAADRPILRPLQAAPEASEEQVQPAFSRAYFAPVIAQIPRPTFFAVPQENQEQSVPQFYRQQLASVLVAPAFRQWIAADQEDQQQPQPLVIQRPLPASQAPVVPPVVVGGGGDRDVVLFREAKEPKVRKPKQANFAVRFFQSGQRFRAVIASEVLFEVATESEAEFEFDATIETESSFAVRASQQQAMAVRITATGQPQKFVPVKASFTALRYRVKFAGGGNNDMQVTFKVEDA